MDYYNIIYNHKYGQGFTILPVEKGQSIEVVKAEIFWQVTRQTSQSNLPIEITSLVLCE